MALVSARLVPGGRREAEGLMKSKIGGHGERQRLLAGRRERKAGGAKGNSEGQWSRQAGPHLPGERAEHRRVLAS